MKPNMDIRVKIMESGFTHYEVAEKIGIAASTFCVWLRTEMNKDKKRRVTNAINELKGGK